MLAHILGLTGSFSKIKSPYSPFSRRWDSKWSSECKTKSKLATSNYRSTSLFIREFEKRPRAIVSWFWFGFRLAFRWPFQVLSCREQGCTGNYHGTKILSLGLYSKWALEDMSHSASVTIPLHSGTTWSTCCCGCGWVYLCISPKLSWPACASACAVKWTCATTAWDLRGVMRASC